MHDILFYMKSKLISSQMSCTYDMTFITYNIDLQSTHVAVFIHLIS